MDMSKIARQQELTKQLNTAANLYYNGGQSPLSNFEWDKLYDELEALEKETGSVMAGSPTAMVGYETLSGLEKTEHKIPALSLAKTKDATQIASFLGDKEGILSWKLDGLTVVLTYDENGALESAVTRGNGYIGDNITAAAKYIKGIPLKLPCQGRKIVRGEALMSYKEFERINSTIVDDGAKYKNPRNLAAGTLRLLDMKELASRNLQFILFTCVAGFEQYKTVKEQFKFCADIGFGVVPFACCNASNVANGLQQMETQINSIGIPVDGAVITFNDWNFGNSLGVVGKYPKGSMAFKWRDTVERTTLRSIIWQRGKTGVQTPVAVFDPVELEGTTVQQASVHNRDIMTKLRLTVGDSIGVYKANMIIPQIAVNYDFDKHPNYVAPMPPESDILDAKREIKIRQLMHYVSRDAMNIVGVAESFVTKLVDYMGVNINPTIFYRLRGYGANDLQAMDITEYSFTKICDAVDASRVTTPDRLLYSMAIPQIGRRASKSICQYLHGDLRKLFNIEVQKSLHNIPDFGEVMENNVIEWFADAENAQILYYLMNNCVKLQMPMQTAVTQGNAGNSKIAGKTFVVTGSVAHYKNRNELQAEIEQLGGKVASSVSKNTDFLINNDINSTSGKNAKAKQLGISIITEEQYMAMR